MLCVQHQVDRHEQPRQRKERERGKPKANMGGNESNEVAKDDARLQHPMVIRSPAKQQDKKSKDKKSKDKKSKDKQAKDKEPKSKKP
ncbi:Hypothetical protein PHPALM_21060 [Phytophthora palmivora]|uniref:Uncharacterized protein n=1 Tax=Phytophthora palmivora TaxID=4796 RepID=A0A2P4XD99_9STRA|nr:Hypothetical protein PHPALM_21060 [Phytophthora palmivora]